MITGLNHIGIAVKSVDETLFLMTKLFGAREIGRKSFPELGQISCLVTIGDLKIELMEPIGTEGVIPKFLAKKGEGLHHISLLSDNVDADCQNFADHGARIISRDKKMAFLHPGTTGGVLYEICEETT